MVDESMQENKMTIKSEFRSNIYGIICFYDINNNEISSTEIYRYYGDVSTVNTTKEITIPKETKKIIIKLSR